MTGHDPLANGRATLLGAVEKLPRTSSTAREAYLADPPQAYYYVDYADFAFGQLHLDSARYIGGHGRMSWVGAEDFRAHAAARILEHMNQTMPTRCPSTRAPSRGRRRPSAP